MKDIYSELCVADMWFEILDYYELIMVQVNTSLQGNLYNVDGDVSVSIVIR